jgi:hypothetical protein
MSDYKLPKKNSLHYNKPLNCRLGVCIICEIIRKGGFFHSPTSLLILRWLEVRKRSIFGLTKTWCETIIPLNPAISKQLL